ncbi:MAG TPA: c-type cytochrome [Nitrospiria bacterium]|nr:c-type cytochrome [Candidatus Manganitrophaceae bacterium]HIL35216.1 c-type cytochrome [Candidatus Manganitrophaceae bacterium]
MLKVLKGVLCGLSVFLMVSLSYGAEADLSKIRVPRDRLKEARALKNPYRATSKNIAKGKALYQTKATCFTCHGKEGRGDGLAAPGLDPSPRNFTNTGFHGMRTDGELFWVIREGIPGTAMMPMVGSVITEDEAWLVLLYERSLGKKK